MRNKLTLKGKSDLGKLVITVGIITLVPLLVIPFYPDEINQAWTFLVPGLGSVLLGLLICFFSKKKSQKLTWRENLQSSSLMVLFVWFYGFFISAVPFYLSKQLPFLRAIFESVSGWTTTGHSVVDVTITSHLFLFHRAWIQFIGGLGFVMMMVMIVQSKQAMSLFHAEGHTDNIAPNLKRTARTIFLMFIGFLTGGTILYRIFGMPVFDGICHSMSALSTAGFSTKAESMGHYNSLPIEIITMVMMIIGIINFAVLLLILKGKFKKVARVTEVKFGFFILAVLTPLMGFGLVSQLHMSLGDGMREAIFNGISAMSTTGYATADFSTWPAFSIGLMIILMLIGGGIGSTAGGIKLIRVYVLLKTLWIDLKKRVSSKRRIFVTSYKRAQGETIISNEIGREVTSFVSMYILIFILGSLALSLTAHCDLTTAMFDFASSLGGVGLTMGITGPHSSDATLIVEIIGMILGRLEIFIVFVGIHSAYSRIKKKIEKITKNMI